MSDTTVIGATTIAARCVVVTGAAGFIGFHLSRALSQAGVAVHGFDSCNDYYDVRLKRDRLAVLAGSPHFTFVPGRLEDDTLARLVADTRPDCVIHMAAQAGVRYSIANPRAYADSNLTGFVNVLEACRQGGVGHLIFASSSSVYARNGKLPFSEHDAADHPVSLYAATKRANELMAHSYAHLFGLPTTGLRLFTVYGPWGRPDMAYYLFTRAVLNGEPIALFNGGDMLRDFTYIDDVVRAVLRLIDTPAMPDPAFDPQRPDPATSDAPFRLYNVGNHTPIELDRLVRAIEAATGRAALRHDAPMQPGDVPVTYADMQELRCLIDFESDTSIEDGMARFIAWYRNYHLM